jgi:hypothetical protein
MDNITRETERALARFKDFSSTARLWVFPLSPKLDPSAAARFEQVIQAFQKEWLSHADPIRSACCIVLDHFLMIVAETSTGQPSGCAIDKLFMAVRDSAREQGLQVTPHAEAWYEASSTNHASICYINRTDLALAIQRGDIAPTQRFFDNSINELSKLRAGQWIIPASSLI